MMPYVGHIDYKALVEKHGKRCTGCKAKKPAKEFSKCSNRHDGRQAYCKQCFKDRYSEVRRAYCKSDRYKKRYRRYRTMYRLRMQEKKRLRAEGITDEELIEHAAREFAEEEYPRYCARMAERKRKKAA